LSDSAFASGEDPFNNPFAEVLTFHGGSYTVFPGVDDAACFVFHHLAKAVFKPMAPLSKPAFAEEARAICAFVLILSDEVARRAGLDRQVETITDVRGPVYTPAPERMQSIIEFAGVPPEEVMSAVRRDLRDAVAPPGPVTVPASGQYNVLRDAVSFTQPEIRSLLARAGAPSKALDALVLRKGTIDLDALDVDDNPLFTKPILYDGEDRYVVAMPRALVLALCNGLVRLAQEHGVEEDIASRYQWSVYSNVEQSLNFMGADRLKFAEHKADKASIFEGLFSLDSDKMIHVLLATDNLHVYDSEKATSRWPGGQGLSDWLQARLKEAEADFLERPDAPNDLLHLVLIQGIAPGVTTALSGLNGLLCHLLMMSARP